MLTEVATNWLRAVGVKDVKVPLSVVAEVAFEEELGGQGAHR